MDRCIFCGCEIPEVLDRHHILPRSKGGPDIPENKLIVCANCHRKIHAFGLIPNQTVANDGWVKLEQLPLWQQSDTEKKEPKKFVVCPAWYLTKLVENRQKVTGLETKRLALIQGDALLLSPSIDDSTKSKSEIRPYILRKYEDGSELEIWASSREEADDIDREQDELEHAEEKEKTNPELEIYPGYLDTNTGQVYIFMQ